MNGPEGRAGALADRGGRERDSPVRQIGDHQLVTRSKRDGSHDRVQSGRHIWDEDQVVRARTDEGRDLVAGFP